MDSTTEYSNVLRSGYSLCEEFCVSTKPRHLKVEHHDDRNVIQLEIPAKFDEAFLQRIYQISEKWKVRCNSIRVEPGLFDNGEKYLGFAATLKYIDFPPKDWKGAA